MVKKLKVPSQLARLTRSLDERKFWKAKEWQNWALYYSVPIFLELVKLKPEFQPFLDHWIKLVEGYHVLLLDTISEADAVRAHDLFKEFVAGTEILYSSDAMRYNIHQFLHVVQSILDWGPAWAHFGYPFENHNGRIKRCVHAAKGVLRQICRYLTMSQALIVLRENVATVVDNSQVLQICDDLENRNTKSSVKEGAHRYFGKSMPCVPSIVQQYNLPEEHTRAYKKLVKDNCVFKSIDIKCYRSDNSFAVTADGDFIQIKQFIINSHDKIEYTVCRKVEVANNQNENLRSMKLITNINPHLIAIETRKLKKLCVVITIEENSYISAVSNMYHFS